MQRDDGEGLKSGVEEAVTDGYEPWAWAWGVVSVAAAILQKPRCSRGEDWGGTLG